MVFFLRPEVLVIFLLSTLINATPVNEDAKNQVVTPRTSLEKRATITLTDAQRASYKPYIFYAAVAACNSSAILDWNCGAKCAANPGFTPVAAGGDGGLVQLWYVGYDSTLKSVIVAFQGTDPEKIIPLITDVDIFLTPPDPKLLPGLSRSIEIHNGFAHAQSLSAASVISAVKTTMAKFNASHITVTGHSLGAAIATISVIHLKVNLPSTTTFNLINYGCPRVGNQAFADYVDSQFPGAVARIVNKRDPTPILLPPFLGYRHVEGEIHILNDLSWVSCPGQDSTAANCTNGYVPNIFFSVPIDHAGPYDGVEVGCT